MIKVINTILVIIILSLLLIFIYLSPRDEVGSFYDAVSEADIIMVVHKTSYIKHVQDSLGIPENFQYKHSDDKYVNIPYITNLGYKNRKFNSKFSSNYSRDRLNRILSSAKSSNYLIPADSLFPLRLSEHFFSGEKMFFYDTELLYTDKEYRLLDHYFFLGNKLKTQRKIKEIVPGDTLIIALKKMSGKNKIKGRLISFTEYPKETIFVPFEDCTSFVRIHGDMCYGQFDHPYSISNPEKYPFKHEVYPVTEVLDKIIKLKMNPTR